MTRLCTLSPSRPAKGLSLTEKLIASVGGSIGRACSGACDRRIGEGVGDGRLDQARDGDDLAGFGAVDRHALEAAEREDLGRAAFLDDIAVHVERLDRHVDGELAALDPAGEDPAEERVAVEQGGEHPERAGVDPRRRNVADDRVEQGRQVARRGRHR